MATRHRDPGTGQQTAGQARASRRPRRHALIGHTADAGIEAAAPDLAQLFEEAALALSELTATIEPGAAAATWEDVTIEGRDLEQLAFGWLNELIGLAGARRSAVAEARVDRVIGPPDPGARVERLSGPPHTGAPGSWRLNGRVALSPFDDVAVRALRDAKAATYHGLRVEWHSGAWHLRAYLDL